MYHWLDSLRPPEWEFYFHNATREAGYNLFLRSRRQEVRQGQTILSTVVSAREIEG